MDVGHKPSTSKKQSKSFKKVELSGFDDLDEAEEAFQLEPVRLPKKEE